MWFCPLAPTGGSQMPLSPQKRYEQEMLTSIFMGAPEENRYTQQCRDATHSRRVWTFPLAVVGAVIAIAAMTGPSSDSRRAN